MPTYDYRCLDAERCGATHTAFHQDRDTAEPCNHCGGPTRRLFPAPARVQNLSASENTLRTWGRDLRFEAPTTIEEKVRRHERERRAGPGRSATMTEEG